MVRVRRRAWRFRSAPGVRIPPSLRNILAEIARERLDGTLEPQAGNRDPSAASGAAASGDLTRWARQGVLLLNTCLTVEQARPASHAKAGWEALTDRLLDAVEQKPEPVVFMLWGAHAQARRPVASGGDTCTAAIAPCWPTTPRRLSARAHPCPSSGAVTSPRPTASCGHTAWLRSIGDGSWRRMLSEIFNNLDIRHFPVA